MHSTHWLNFINSSLLVTSYDFWSDYYIFLDIRLVWRKKWGHFPWLVQNIWIPRYRSCNAEELAEFKINSLFWFSFRTVSLNELEDMISRWENKLTFVSHFSYCPQMLMIFQEKLNNELLKKCLTYLIQVNLCHLWQVWITYTFSIGGKKLIQNLGEKMEK